MKTALLLALLFTGGLITKEDTPTYDLPEEMPIAEPGDQFEVYKRDTVNGRVTIYLQFVDTTTTHKTESIGDNPLPARI